MNESSSRAYLTRKEAADYLSKNWIKISWETLARYAVLGIGPIYHQVPGAEGAAQYLKSDLDAWAKSFPVVNIEDRAGKKRGKTLAPSKARGALATAGARR